MSKPYTVSEITRHIRDLLEREIPTVWVEGEISNFKRHSSGHLYFTMKDERSQLRCIMWKWRAQRLFFTPQDGMKILAQGDISVYEKAGQYQLIVQQVHPAGVGELQLAFEQLKEKLKSEGLFDEKYKKSLPEFPQTIGVVTSETGAAIRDIINVTSRRFPPIQIILRPTRVQGNGAADDIAEAIRQFNRYKKVDLLIVGRGGGSLEELWAFNEELVARAIFESEIPIVSAVGHEIDFTVTDFVADKRAPTPSAAAELAVKDKIQLQEYINSLTQRQSEEVQRNIRESENKLTELCSSYAFRRFSNALTQNLQRIDELKEKLIGNFDFLTMNKIANFKKTVGKLDALSPLSTFKKGFSLCRKLPGMKVVKDSRILHIKDSVKIYFYRGEALCKVESTDHSSQRTPKTENRKDRS